MIQIPDIFKQFENVKAAQSNRIGGFSHSPFDSFNLGLSTTDDAKAIAENRKLFFNQLGTTEDHVAHSHQVHGNKVLVADHAQHANGYDAVITNKQGLFAVVTVADCTPILVYDHKQKAVASIHAGWKGTVEKIVKETLHEMNRQYGTVGTDCYAYIGTCISYQSFEVDSDVADRFDETVKRFDTKKQKYFIDLKAANKAQLNAFGLQDDRIEISTACTVLNNDTYFSYRKENGQTGRMLAARGLVSLWIIPYFCSMIAIKNTIISG